jgi:hypothetical protein
MKTIKFPSDSSKQQEKEKLDKLVQSSKEVIYGISTVFPFNFFPDTITVVKEKVDITYGVFFSSKEVFSILTPDIRGVVIDHGLYFATLHFEVIGYERNPDPVKYLKVGEAVRMRRIILGLIACDKEKIDLSHFSTKELRTKLEEIGMART